MSPTPSVTEDGACKSFRQAMAGSVGNEEQSPETAMNGHAGTVKSAYFQHQMETPEKRGRGRPPKSAAKQQQVPNGAIKKRGRPPKVKSEGVPSKQSKSEGVPSKQSKITDTMKKTKRTVDRFKGVTKEELMERFLPDRIKQDLDILIIGINPGLFAAYKGHHYAGPGNHFWSCINMSGFVDRQMTADNDEDLLDYGIGFSTIVERTTPGAKDLSSKEIREGAKKLIEKIQLYKPKIAVFNGKGIYEIFSKEIFAQKKKDFVFGTQVNKIPGTETFIYVMPSSSARCAQFPRAQDKVHFYVKLKQLRDEIKGHGTDAAICEVGYSFDLQKATELAKVQHIKQERIDPGYEGFGAAATNGTTCYPVFSTAQDAATSSAIAAPGPGTSHNAMDVNNNNNAISKIGQAERQVQATSSNTQLKSGVKKIPEKEPQKKDDSEENSITANHAHLARYLKLDMDSQGADSSHGRKVGVSGAVLPVTLSPRNPKLQEDVSDQQRQERVGNWVREQQNLEYDSEPPMGMERREENLSGLQEGGAGVEIDGASQLSAISAGISGSASESTSGYGSIDASSRRVRLDRVEMWVMEQQHVRRHNAANQQQLQQSIQAASSSAQNPPPASSRMQPHFQINPVTSWQQMMPQNAVGYTVPGPVAVSSVAGHPIYANANRIKDVLSVHASNHPNIVSEQLPGTSGLNPSLSAGRSSPYGFARTPRRDGGSGSSFGTSVRPPVPLFSSWGGEESSGGSGISSPAVMFPPNPATQPSPTSPFVMINNSTSAPHTTPRLSAQSYNVLPMSWSPAPSSSSLLTPNYNL